MDRRIWLRRGGGLDLGFGVAVVGCTAPSVDAAFREWFEDGVGDWATGGVIGPEVDVAEFECDIDVSTASGASGPSPRATRPTSSTACR